MPRCVDLLAILAKSIRSVQSRLSRCHRSRLWLAFSGLSFAMTSDALGSVKVYCDDGKQLYREKSPKFECKQEEQRRAWATLARSRNHHQVVKKAPTGTTAGARSGQGLQLFRQTHATLREVPFCRALQPVKGIRRPPNHVVFTGEIQPIPAPAPGAARPPREQIKTSKRAPARGRPLSCLRGWPVPSIARPI